MNDKQQANKQTNDQEEIKKSNISTLSKCMSKLPWLIVELWEREFVMFDFVVLTFKNSSNTMKPCKNFSPSRVSMEPLIKDEKEGNIARKEIINR